MASIRKIAQEMLDAARDGIAWIAIWREGKGWNGWEFYPDIDKDENLIFDADDIEHLRDIIKTDPNAIIVNSWYYNLGDTECMTRDTLANALRWQYDNQNSRIAVCLPTEKKKTNTTNEEMSMNKITESRRMEMSDLRKLCIKNEWCTLCTEEQYDGLLRMTKADNLTTNHLQKMAERIKWYSGEVADDCEITSIMYELARICYTVFEEVA